MPDNRLKRCRESYQIVNCKMCGLPTTTFEHSCEGVENSICGGCAYKILKLKEDGQFSN